MVASVFLFPSSSPDPPCLEATCSSVRFLVLRVVLGKSPSSYATPPDPYALRLLIQHATIIRRFPISLIPSLYFFPDKGVQYLDRPIILLGSSVPCTPFKPAPPNLFVSSFSKPIHAKVARTPRLVRLSFLHPGPDATAFGALFLPF